MSARPVREVSWRNVPCPLCARPPYEPCTDVHGHPHAARLRAAGEHFCAVNAQRLIELRRPPVRRPPAPAQPVPPTVLGDGLFVPVE